MTPKVVAITINYNQSEHTKECLCSLLNSSYKNLEVYVVDNGSSFEDYANLKRFIESQEKKAISLFRKDNNIGYVGGINFGMEAASRKSSDYFLILNNDTLIEQGSLANLVKVSEKYKQNSIVSGKVLDYENKQVLQYVGQYKDPKNGINQLPVVKNNYELDRGQYDREMEMGMLDDIYWLIPRKLYGDIGGYSDYFFLYGEQNDYAFRALSKGYKLIYTPDSRLWHKGSITTGNGDRNSAKIDFWKRVAILKLSELHLPKRKSKSFRINWILRETLKSIYYLIFLKRPLKYFKSQILAIWYFYHWKSKKYKDNGFNPFSQD